MRRFFVLLLLSGIAQSDFAYAVDNNCSNLSAIEPFTIDNFLTTLVTKEIDSIEKALCLIPPTITHNAVLVNSSQSLQNGTLTNPRAIMFDPGTQFEPVKFAISFNGDAEQKQYHSLEIIKFDAKAPAEEQMIFLDVHFDEIKKSVQITKNPQSCFACHSFNTPIPRPLWDANLFSPAAYGSHSTDSHSQVDEEFYRKSKYFAENYRNHPRYKFLGSIKFDIKVWFNFAELNKDVSFRRATTFPFYQIVAPDLREKNNEFAIRLAILNRRRIAKLIYDSPDYNKYKYAISSVLLGCDQNVIDLIPSEKLVQFDNRFGTPEIFHTTGISDKTIDQVFAEKNGYFNDPAKFNRDHKTILKSINNDPKYYPLLPYYVDTELNTAQWFFLPFEMIGQLRWLFEARGISMQTWNIDSSYFSHGFYRFINHPGGFTSSPGASADLSIVLQELINIDHSLEFISAAGTSQKEFASHLLSIKNTKTCSKLKTKSLNQLK